MLFDLYVRIGSRIDFLDVIPLLRTEVGREQ